MSADNNRNAAVLYIADSYDASGKCLPVVGRTAAGEGFLKALAMHGNLEQLYCFSRSQDEYNKFRLQIERLYGKHLETSLVEWEGFQELQKPGCLYVPEPSLEIHAWNRRSLVNQRAYSICGITHTIAHNNTIGAISALLTAPMQSWDALICTSGVVRDTVTGLLQDWAEYLEQKGTGSINIPLQLPVIPLGIDSEQFRSRLETDRARSDIRQHIGAGKDDIVILYLGRLSVNIKANPYSMLTCIEAAAGNTERKIHLVIAGWFQDEVNAKAYSEAIRMFCPSVNAVMMDGRQDAIRKFIWFAADIFVSLVDNIQETFGISPLEAMAAGLPVVVTDWDGYRDTVINGETGYRIPTAFPSRGAGAELATRFSSGIDTFESYLGHCSAATVIDAPSCVEAFVRLVNESALRRQMGEKGRKHVRDNFDWKHVINRYQDLWQELAQRRLADRESVPLKPGYPANPVRQDPFRLFSSYPTTEINDGTRLWIDDGSKAPGLDEIYASGLFAQARPLLLSLEKCREIIEFVRGGEVLTVDEIEKVMKAKDRGRLRRTIAWLAKTGRISIRQ